MMYSSLFFELALTLSMFVSILTALKNEGYQPEESERVLKGIKAEDGQFPFMFALYQYGKFACSATVISRNTILTAAHCVTDANGALIRPWNLEGVVGTVNVNGQGGSMIPILDVKTHPDYNPSTLINDIAILTPNVSLEFTPKIQPVYLNTISPIAEKSATVIGWGKYSRLGGASDVLRFNNNQKLLSHALCALRNFPSIIDRETQFCVDGNGFGACNGDSGGPLVVSRDNKAVQLGIVSFGKAFLCDTFLIAPVVYTRVSAFFDWILQASGDTEIAGV